ncbi:MAG: hypothetical protein R3357_07450 [Burkholderiales bacterium]|nr:hypothetical protein [Burkholderiales bacterium]
MEILGHDDYLALRAGARVLAQDRFGDKVLALADGTILKLFRRKRLISSAAWYPYAQRFADNARTLAALRIPCPEVTGVYRLPSVRREAVRYRPLEGETLRALARAGADAPELRARLAGFVAGLHASGVYFRSLHLGNIVLTPCGALGLIDVADLRVARRPLSAARRQRNLRHLVRIAEDRAWIRPAGDATFDEAYRRHAPGA